MPSKCRVPYPKFEMLPTSLLVILSKDDENYVGFLSEQCKSMPIQIRNLQLILTKMHETKRHLNPPFMKDSFTQ